VLVDVGSTTTDVIPILDGTPWTHGKTDTERLRHQELVYTGVKRTPLCALLPPGETCAEFFATSLDAHLLLGHIPEDPIDCDTADGRAATVRGAHSRIAHMMGGDRTTVTETEARRLAATVADTQFQLVLKAVEYQTRRAIGLQRESLGVRRWAVVSGSGEFLARRAVQSVRANFDEVISLNDRLGPGLSECAPAFAVATLAKEKPL
jgi:hypothetical protein